MVAWRPECIAPGGAIDGVRKPLRIPPHRELHTHPRVIRGRLGLPAAAQMPMPSLDTCSRRGLLDSRLRQLSNGSVELEPA